MPTCKQYTRAQDNTRTSVGENKSFLHTVYFTPEVLEAMLHGLVVVTTPVGVEGIASVEDFPGYVVQNGGEDHFLMFFVDVCR